MPASTMPRAKRDAPKRPMMAEGPGRIRRPGNYRRSFDGRRAGAVARMVAMAAAVARAAPRTVSNAAEADVFDGHAFVDGGALLKKSIQGVTVAPMSARTMRRTSLLKPGSGCQVTKAWPTGVPTGVGHERDWNEDQVEYGGGEGGCAPRSSSGETLMRRRGLRAQ